MSRKELENRVIDKLLNDMIYTFECDQDEKIAALESIATVDTIYLLQYLND